MPKELQKIRKKTFILCRSRPFGSLHKGGLEWGIVSYRRATVDAVSTSLDDVLKDQLTAITQLKHFEVQCHRRSVRSSVQRLYDLLHSESIIHHTPALHTHYSSHISLTIGTTYVTRSSKGHPKHLGASLAEGHAHFSTGCGFYGGHWPTPAACQIWSC